MDGYRRERLYVVEIKNGRLVVCRSSCSRRSGSATTGARAAPSAGSRDCAVGPRSSAVEGGGLLVRNRKMYMYQQTRHFHLASLLGFLSLSLYHGVCVSLCVACTCVFIILQK